ncbi:MAG: RNA 2',3'-cyclic phosphodiesterase [Chloroflexota bacterium]
MEPVRAFIAIPLPAPFRQSLWELQTELKAGNPPPAKWVSPEGCHLTLSFLGNVGADRIEAITRAMENAAAGVIPFDLKMGRIGGFPGVSRAQVIWVGLEGDLDKLLELKTRLDAELSPLGFPPEERAFTPHLTMARLRDRVSPPERERLAKLISDTTPKTFPEMHVTQVNLMRSYLTGEGAVYRCLSQAALNGPAKG